jgi:hypothetical protein
MSKFVKTTLLLTFFLNGLLVPLTSISAASNLDVVINEIAWAGSNESSDDEWIELKNNLSTDVNLNGFKLFDDGDLLYEFSAEIILANSYFLIEKNENATLVTADLIISNLSLANTGDTLLLEDNLGNQIDIVNSSGGSWYAGSNTSKKTMARINSLISGDLSSNWSSAEGTPKSENNVEPNSSGGTSLALLYSGQSVSLGMDFLVDVYYSGEEGIYSYGLEIEFDPALVEFKGATESNLLSEEGDRETSFESGLLQGTNNVLLVAGARLMQNKQNLLNATGVLATLAFEVIGNTSNNIIFNLKEESFISDLNSDLNIEFNDLTIVLSASSLANVTNAQAILGSDRYSFDLSWSPVTQASSYIIEIKNTNGEFEQLSEINNTLYSYNEDIVPEIFYEFRIFAKSGQLVSEGVTITIKETRGIRGDFDRNDKVDGRDLQLIANTWSLVELDANFSALVDLNRDGQINALDLFFLASNWGGIYN